MPTTAKTNKNERIEARVTADVKALLTQAAAIQGRSVTDFMVDSTVKAARQTIRESEYLDLSQRDRLAFVKAVLNAPPPSDRLMQAAKRHKQMFGEW